MQDADIRTPVALAVYVGLVLVLCYYCGFLICKLRDFVVVVSFAVVRQSGGGGEFV
jgi:hypothetical protein